MVRRSLLRHQTPLGLHCAHCRHFNAGIYKKTPPKIQAKNDYQTTTLPVHASTETIRGRSTSPAPNRHLPQVIRQKKRNSTNRNYARAVDITVLMALSSIASEQTRVTTNMMAKAKQLLDYIATHPDATIRFRASDMILNVHSDASYLSETKAHSRACGHFFMGWSLKDGDPVKLNGAFFTLCTILRFVVASAAEAELGALFLNCKEGIIF